MDGIIKDSTLILSYHVNIEEKISYLVDIGATLSQLIDAQHRKN